MAISRKTCLITGCSEGGAGAALAEAFQARGYHVFATARSTSKIPQALHTATNVTVLALDVTSPESIAAAAKDVPQETGGKLDVLVNNAGVGLNMPALDTPLDEARRLFDVNFFSALAMVQAFIPMLIEARGCVVNNTSAGAVAPLPFLSVYQGSKAALLQFGEVLRLELAPLGVGVLTLLTGGVATKFVDNQQTPALPDGSYYASVRDVIGHQPEKIPFAVAPRAYAREVLRHVEKGTAGKLWIGGGVGLIRWAVRLLPQSALVSIARLCEGDFL